MKHKHTFCFPGARGGGCVDRQLRTVTVLAATVGSITLFS